MPKTDLDKSNELIKRQAKVEALGVLEETAREFPGLLDGETDVNGAELIEHLTRALKWNASVRMHLKNQTKG